MQETVQAQVIEYLKQTPKAVGVLVCSFFSGQLWVFIIFAYLKKGSKGNKIIKSITGKTGIGLCWFSLVLIPVYYINNGDFFFMYEKIIELVIPTIIFGFFAQILIFGLFVTFGNSE